MSTALGLTLLVTGLTQPGGEAPAPDARQKLIESILKKDGPWLKAYSEAAMALLDAKERAAVEKLKPLGFKVEGRGPPALPAVWKDGQKFVEPPRGIDLAYVPEPWTPASKPRWLKDLVPLAELRHVEKLQFRDTNLTGDMLDWLKGMNDLWYLDITTSRITDAGLKKLAHMKRLQHLHLQFLVGITDAGVPSLSDLPNLADLDLSSTRVGDKGVAALAKNVKLVNLSLGATPVGDAGVIALAGLPQLHGLGLGRTRVTDKGLAAMAVPGYFPSPANLNLSETAVTDAGLKKAKITDASLKQLAALPAMTVLSLRGCAGVTGKGLVAFEGNERLTVLDLGETASNDAAVASIRKLPKLQTLGMDRTKLTDKGLVELAKPGSLPKLRLINAIETIVSDEGLKALHDPAVLPSLTLVHVERTRVTADGAAALRKARPRLTPSPY